MHIKLIIKNVFKWNAYNFNNKHTSKVKILFLPIKIYNDSKNKNNLSHITWDMNHMIHMKKNMAWFVYPFIMIWEKLFSKKKEKKF